MTRKITSGLLALAVIAVSEPALEQFVPKHEGTPVPVTVYEYDGYDAYQYQDWKYNAHSNSYFLSNSGTVDGTYVQDETGGYAVVNPWTEKQDGYVSSRWGW